MAYYQGFFRPLNPKKYRGNVKEIVYRSGWEAQMMIYLDATKKIVAWSSEEVIIPYMHPFKGRMARYFMDFWWKELQPDGTTKEFLCEVKPFKQTQRPVKTMGKNGRPLKEAVTYAINTAKWEAAEKFAKANNMTFIKLTEQSKFNGVNFQRGSGRRSVKRIRAKQNSKRS